ncbi:hypothetical protein NECAME_10353 [Necator americanus]|uniref:KATNIP domain-containing protein n=1 Tax=Necator americanus TaxID=51031 RepID=W2T8U5_NECAM|nr:hypothetical protein NECAME_10353 [Necator americanus]ETN78430.1 hypothetical protein NECAME_10353 [Necator americanus]
MEPFSYDEYSSEIPELPSGKLLRLVLLSNWGDDTYVGLNAVEIFKDDGKRPDVAKISSNATHSIGDVESIFVESFTCTDQGKMWRAELQTDRPLIVEITFTDTIRIAMLRFWNYSESRVHAQMGVRNLRAELDDIIVFEGEVDCAFADHESEPMGETVLFTVDESILEAIAENDVCLIPDFVQSPTLDVTEFALGLTPQRPVTRETSTSTHVNERPISATLPDIEDDDTSGKVKILHLELCENWGAPGSIGLCGLELLGQKQNVIDSTTLIITTSTQSDAQRLLNGKNLTRSPDDMWLIPFDPKQHPTITINFQKPTTLSGISFWNYNASPEMSYAGVRLLHIFINGRLAASNVLLRKAPGFVFFDFVQDISIERPPNIRPLMRPNTRSIYGFIFQLQLLSSWGDEFYIGLNGVELYDTRGEKINVGPQNLAAFPESVNILPSVENDPRTSMNLINGCNDTEKAELMWLTPMLPNRCARVFFVFDVPIAVSAVVIYNYRKTPARGVRHISVSADDLIVYSGDVPASSAEKTGILEIDFREM